MYSKRSLAVFAASALLVIATGAFRSAGFQRSNPASTIPASPADACTLLSQAEVSTALGVSVSPGSRVVPSNALICGWAEPGKPRVTARKLLLTLMTARQFDLGKTPMQGTTKAPVSGIGDDAYYVTAGGLGTALSVKKGSTFFQVKVGGEGYTPEALKAMEKKLALEVLARI